MKQRDQVIKKWNGQKKNCYDVGACGGTTPQGGGLRVRLPVGSLEIIKWLFCRHSVALGFHSASNSSEYQGISLGVKCGRRVELTTMPSWLGGISKEGWNPNIPSTPWVFVSCLGNLYLYYDVDGLMHSSDIVSRAGHRHQGRIFPSQTQQDGYLILHKYGRELVFKLLRFLFLTNETTNIFQNMFYGLAGNVSIACASRHLHKEDCSMHLKMACSCNIVFVFYRSTPLEKPPHLRHFINLGPYNLHSRKAQIPPPKKNLRAYPKF